MHPLIQRLRALFFKPKLFGPEPGFSKPFANWQGGRFQHVIRSGKSDTSRIPGTKHSVLLAFFSPNPLFDGTPSAGKLRPILHELARIAATDWAISGVAKTSGAFPRYGVSYLQVMLQHGPKTGGDITQIVELQFEWKDGRLGPPFLQGDLITVADTQTHFVA